MLFPGPLPVPCSDGNSAYFYGAKSFGSFRQDEPALSTPKGLPIFFFFLAAYI